MIEVAPSILAANFSKLGEEIKSVEDHCRWLHIDIMDGHFVPNISIGPGVVKDIRRCTKLLFDVHLMIESPHKYIEEFIKSGADMITVHAETDICECLTVIKERGLKCGISVKPKTDLGVIERYIGIIDTLLIMTVEPGFGGQEFIMDMLPKIKEARVLYPELIISVDGGINKKTANYAITAGADVLIAGSAVFSATDKEKAINLLRGSDI